MKQIAPAASEQNKNNLLRWNLKLEPQEKKIIKVAYVITHPLSLELYINFTNQEAPQQKNRVRDYQKF